MFAVCLFLFLPKVTYLPGVMPEAFGKQHVCRVPVLQLTANILAHGKLPFSRSGYPFTNKHDIVTMAVGR
jgi:hypothetical protein